MPRRRRHSARLVAASNRKHRSIRQLVATVVALAMLFAVWDQLASGAAGCFTSRTHGPEEGTSSHDAPQDGARDAASLEPAFSVKTVPDEKK